MIVLVSLLLFLQDTRQLIELGMQKFSAGQIEASLVDFDAANRDPQVAPHLWQRGIALYYVGKFEEGRKQFEIHRSVNPNDVENATWWYLCMAKLGRREEARRGLLPVGPDDRVPMTEIYSLYAGRGTEKEVLAAIAHGNPSEGEKRMREFYGQLYLALYADAAGDARKAQEHLRKCVATKVGGYMADVARIHLERLR